jgi:hypothetical protein
MPGVKRAADINMNIQCIDNETAFLALRDEWEALRLSSEAPSYFLLLGRVEIEQRDEGVRCAQRRSSGSDCALDALPYLG